MQTYAQLKKQIAELEKKAEEARQAEITQAVQQVKDIIAVYGLTARDLGLSMAAKGLRGPRGPRPGAGIPKYRDPKTGKTWTGHGKPPGWIATKKNRDEFLIDKPAAQSAAAAPARLKRKTAAPTPQKAA